MCKYPLFFLYNRSGASATGCRHQVTLGERYLDLHQNPVLGEGGLPPCRPTLRVLVLLIFSPTFYSAEDLAVTAQRCYSIPTYWTEQPAPASTDFVRIIISYLCFIFFPSHERAIPQFFF